VKNATVFRIDNRHFAVIKPNCISFTFYLVLKRLLDSSIFWSGQQIQYIKNWTSPNKGNKIN